MFIRLKSLILFVSIVSISCIVFNCIGKNGIVDAQDTKSNQNTECPLDKNKPSSCKTISWCVSHCCCERTPKCYHGCHCPHKHECHTHCEKGSERPKDEDHCVSDMLSLTHCAKKRITQRKDKSES